LRIVEDFEIRYAAFRGLNLTFEVREGIIKHSRDYDPAQFPELAEYLLDQRPPLEAQLIDVADEIAYCTADLDDGYEARLLALEDIRENVPVFEKYFEEVENLYPDAMNKLKFNEAQKGMLDRFVGDLIRNTQRMIAETGVRSVEAVRQHGQRLVMLSPEVEAERRETKQFLYENLYFSPSLDEEKDDAEIIVGSLFEYWMEHPEALPHPYQEKAEGEPLPRVVCDYIAGMTDTFIYEQYEKHIAQEN